MYSSEQFYKLIYTLVLACWVALCLGAHVSILSWLYNCRSVFVHNVSFCYSKHTCRYSVGSMLGDVSQMYVITSLTKLSHHPTGHTTVLRRWINVVDVDLTSQQRRVPSGITFSHLRCDGIDVDIDTTLFLQLELHPYYVISYDHNS